MKPCYLEFCGINSFSERAQIDFTALLEFGIFGIFGDTGSGKSTILDCIGFALYGNVGRSRSGSIADIINYRADKAYVHFEFELFHGGKRRRYRVERELKRKNAVQSVRVYEYEEGVPKAVAEGVRESNALLEEIIGLEQKDFEKCIALPQGEFAQFVRSARSDRLKLIARLFDLEEYGERLVKKTNARYLEAERAYELAATRMEQYEGATEEALHALSAETEQLAAQERATRVQEEALRKEENTLNELFTKKKQAESLLAQLAALEAEKESIARLEGEMERLEKAAALINARKELASAVKERERAERELREVSVHAERAAQLTAELSSWKEEEVDAEINRLSEQRVRAEQAASALKKREETAQALKAMRIAYLEEAARFVGFSYEAEREAIEKRLNALENEDFLTYFEREGKKELFKGEYAVFCGELKDIITKHPVTERTVEPLVKKYQALSEGEQTDFAAVRSKYEARERARKEEQAKLVDLEKKNGLYRTHCNRLQQLQTDGVRLKRELTEWEERLKETEGLSLKEIDLLLSAKKREKREKAEARSNAVKEEARLSSALAVAKERLFSLTQVEEKLSLGIAPLQKGFECPEEAEALLKEYGSAEAGKKRAAEFKERYTAVTARYEDYKNIDFSSVTEERVALVRARLSAAEREREEAGKLFAVKKEALTRLKERIEKRRELEKECAALQKKAELYERLKKLFEANKFMDFVAEEYLSSVAENASARLISLTDGRYFLRYEGGSLGFAVGDNFNGGKTRGVYTLSGGETFLVSLSLALALSAEICSRSMRPIEFFFLDEGFGTLDERLVDTVMDSLERLKGEHFAIGIISHVEELKHRIDKKLSVEKATERHGSQIYTE